LIVLGAVAVAVVAIVVTMAMRNRAAHSSVDSFRRQIDALGPEARRTVVDQVQSAAGRDADSSDDEGGEAADEDGARDT
jgi:hypothetical protein